VVSNGAILEHAKTCSGDYIILRLLWRSGMRVSELSALTPSDLEPYNQVLNITKAKGKKQRRVVVDPPMFAYAHHIYCRDEHPEEQPIFDLSSVQVWNIVKKYGRMINVDIHPHTFRHSFAIHLVRLGSMWQVQLLLGHANLNITQLYLQPRDADLKDVYNHVAFL
jgi:site-specific recombinase XerD